MANGVATWPTKSAKLQRPGSCAVNLDDAMFEEWTTASACPRRGLSRPSTGGTRIAAGNCHAAPRTGNYLGVVIRPEKARNVTLALASIGHSLSTAFAVRGSSDRYMICTKLAMVEFVVGRSLEVEWW